MATIHELYKELGELLSKYPEIKDFEVCACGVESRLNIFRQDPDGPVTGISLEDASYMKGSEEMAEELVNRFGVSLSEEHMEYLVQMCCFEEPSEQELEDFVQKYGKIKGVEKNKEIESPLLIYELKDKALEVYYENGFYCVSDFHCLSEQDMSEYLKNTYDIEIASNEIVAGLYEKKFGIEPNETKYYLKKYEELVEGVVKEEDAEYEKAGIPEEQRDYGAAIGEAETYANHDEVIGYYMTYYTINPLKAWMNNTEGFTLIREQDQAVTKTLQKLFGEEIEKSKTLRSLDEKISGAKNGVCTDFKQDKKEKDEVLR